MKNIHLRLEADEALDSRRNLLLTEINLLNLRKIISEYLKLRKEEFLKKQELKKKLKELVNDINKLKEELPKTRLPKIEKKPVIIEKTKKLKLEDELKEIQEKLEQLNKE